MKYISKFIAVGLGCALMFTGTNFVQGMFTSRSVQQNIITIQSPKIEVNAGNAYFSGKNTGGAKYNKLYIPVNVSGIDSNKLKIEAKVDGKKNGTEIKGDNITIGKGVHTANDAYPNDTKKDSIIITLPEGFEFGVKETYNITLTVEINAEKPILIFEGKYWLTKGDQSNDCNGSDGLRIQHIPMNDGHTNLKLLEEIPADIENNDGKIEESSGIKVVEPSKEKTDIPSDPEIVEPTKEEVEVPSESDALENLKQPEVIEPLKENEIIQE